MKLIYHCPPAVRNAAFAQEVEAENEVCEEAKSVNEAQLKDGGNQPWKKSRSRAQIEVISDGSEARASNC